jgi:hypothetical protein
MEFARRVSLRDEGSSSDNRNPGFEDSPGAKLTWPFGPKNTGRFWAESS